MLSKKAPFLDAKWSEALEFKTGTRKIAKGIVPIVASCHDKEDGKEGIVKRRAAMRDTISKLPEEVQKAVWKERSESRQ